jgi:uncharacterized protein (DUF736 family)
MPKDPNEVGCFWIKESAKGTKFLSGKIDGIGSVVVFKNKNKKSDKQPDYRVLRSQPKEKSDAAAKEDRGF